LRLEQSVGEALGLQGLLENLHNELYCPEAETLLEHVCQLKEQNQRLTGYLKDAEEEMKKVLGMAAGGAIKRKRRQVDNEAGGDLRPFVKRARRETILRIIGQSPPR
jgi:hypothetical protein